MNTSEEKEDLMQQFGDQIPFSSPSVVESYICGIVTDDDLANAWVDEFGVKYSSDRLRLLKAPADLETYVIKEGCKIICVRAFRDCTKLMSIEIPDSVTSIGTGAFSGCSSLESITLPFVGDKPHTATDDYQYPFGYIFGTDSYTGGTVTEQNVFGNSVYCIPSSLKSVIITGSSHIPRDAFFGCTGLTRIEIPSSVTSIGVAAFSDCIGLTRIEIPDSVTSIGAGAFDGCSGLTRIEIPSSVTRIGDSAFDGTAWYNNQPDGLVYVGKVAYKYKGTMPDNTNIVLADGTLEIAGNAFSGCTGLTSIEIPSGVTSIGDYAFEGCTGVTSIEIPGSVTSIGGEAFSGCTSLTSIVMPDKLRENSEEFFADPLPF